MPKKKFLALILAGTFIVGAFAACTPTAPQPTTPTPAADIPATPAVQPQCYNTPMGFIAVIRRVRVFSDVDVRVFSSASGELMAAIINGEAQNVSHLISTANVMGEKIVYLPANGGYIMELTATGDGAVSVTIGEHSHAIGRYARITNWFDIPVETGDVLNVSIPRFSAEDAADISSGSHIPYTLTNGADTITPDMDISDDSIQAARHTVSFESSDFGTGIVMGGGGRGSGRTYIEGFLTRVYAIPLEGYVFSGWYVDGERVSEDNVHRFRVFGDTKLIAQFTPAIDDVFRQRPYYP